jgi:eukaryotic-like serine/threonine-protein kinase
MSNAPGEEKTAVVAAPAALPPSEEEPTPVLPLAPVTPVTPLATGQTLPARVPALGQTVAGRYTVLAVLGQGGMGVVLAAYDARLDRRVALKLLHSHLQPQVQGEESLQVRLEREAQAMARLSHPHVVAVYDAGYLEDGALYLAMEHVEGQTLRAWCQQQPRTWREVLAAYLEAARGLAAAHAAGLVHRDFKPDNVLVGKDGRVRVTDFGVARAEALPSPAPQVPLAIHSQAWEQTLTLPGKVVGTPRYLAPELLRGQPADVRSDLFAFCVALYEALYAQPAFPGGTPAERMQAQLEGRVNAPPSQAQVPAWVERAVLQGLSAPPEQRPATLWALIAALEDDPRERWRGWVKAAVLVGAGMSLATLASWGWMDWKGPACGGMERRLTGVWDTQVRARVRQALEETGLPYAQDTAQRVEQWLDTYAQTWVDMSLQVCEQAGSERQARGLPALQQVCLERRRSQLRSLTELLARGPDQQLVSGAVQAVASLPPLSYCADERALTAEVPPPEDPAVRARVEALQPEVDRLEALGEAGKYQEGLALAPRVLEQVRQAGFAPLRARALYHAAWLEWGAGGYAGAEARARESILLAAQSKDSMLEARAWSLLGRVVRLQGRLQEAPSLQLALEAAGEAAGDERAWASSLNEVGNLHWALGQNDQALACHERALALFEKALGPEHPWVAGALTDLGNALWALRRYEEAQALQARTLAILERALGPEHPEVAGALTNLCNLLYHMGRHAEALPHCQRAVALSAQALGPEHHLAALSLNNLGLVLLSLGRQEEARPALERALALLEKALGPEHPDLAEPLEALGAVHLSRARPAQALPLLKRALPLAQGNKASVQLALARALWDSGVNLLRAVELATQAQQLWQRMGHPRASEAGQWLASHHSPSRKAH